MSASHTPTARTALFDGYTAAGTAAHAAAWPDELPVVLDFFHRNAFLACIDGSQSIADRLAARQFVPGQGKSLRGDSQGRLHV